MNLRNSIALGALVLGAAMRPMKAQDLYTRTFERRSRESSGMGTNSRALSKTQPKTSRYPTGKSASETQSMIWRI